MSKKPTGLSAFTAKRALSTTAPAAEPDAAPAATAEVKRSRAQGETVALTVRVSRADWTRLHQLAVAEGVSIQTLAVRGLSHVFEAQGLPSLG
ncbi:MAG: hypothetical protein ACRYG8_05285 [Janthinobacterium lividum]